MRAQNSAGAFSTRYGHSLVRRGLLHRRISASAALLILCATQDRHRVQMTPPPHKLQRFLRRIGICGLTSGRELLLARDLVW